MQLTQIAQLNLPSLQQQVLPHFFNLVCENSFLKTLLIKKQISEYDLADRCYENIKHNNYSFRYFQLSNEETFPVTDILITSFGTIVEFLTTDTKYFDDAAKFFSTNSKGRFNLPYHDGEKQQRVQCKRLKRLALFDREVDCYILKSNLFGCKITLSIR